MNDRTWPHRSETSHFTTLPFPIKSPNSNLQNPNSNSNSNSKSNSINIRQFRSSSSSRRSDQFRDYASLPNDVLTKIAANFSLPNLQTASLVCKAWRDGLRPLREAMLFLRWGKRFKHGRGGVKKSVEKALDSFLKGAARGSTLAMVDAGLLYWEMGRKEEGVALYRRAAELGDPAGQCNLGISYLQAEPPNVKEAVKWLYQASVAGYVRGQYQLALCLHRGIGTDQNLAEAAKWYLRAAAGGYVRAMYNVSLCYSLGKGFSQNHRQARKWMKLAADHAVGVLKGIALVGNPEFAIVDEAYPYIAQNDKLKLLKLGSLQHFGDNMLAFLLHTAASSQHMTMLPYVDDAAISNILVCENAILLNLGSLRAIAILESVFIFNYNRLN